MNGWSLRNNQRTVFVILLILCLITTLLITLDSYKADAAVSGRNLPSNGKILFFMGQDTTTLTGYKQAVLNSDSTIPKPGGVTLYTNIVLGGSPSPLAGMTGTTANWGAGNVNFNTTLNQYPNAALAVGLYLSDASTGCNNQPLRAIIGRNNDDVTAGNPSLTTQYRNYIDQMITIFKGYNRQVFLRIGYEYDGPWNCYNSDFYKQAFQYIKGRIDALGATQVATVWQSATWPLNTNTDHPEYNYIVTAANHFDAWYPGDQYVDWIAFSSFYNSGSVDTQWNGTAMDADPVNLQNKVLNFARTHNKPIMISESAPQGYQTGAQTKSSIMNNMPQAASGTTIWNEWYAPFFNFIEANRDVIRAVAYINTNWDSQASWQCQVGASAGGPGCSNGYWGDSRIQANATIKTNFINELKKNIYVNGTGG